jgi:hypothetical protein
MPRFTKWAGPLAGLILLGAEAVIAVAGIWFPRVDVFYHDYYISRTRTCWLPSPVADRARDDLRRGEIIIAALDPPERCYLLMGGWNIRSSGWAGTSMPVARLDIPILPGEHSVELALTSLMPDVAQPVGIFVNGNFMRNVTLPANAAGEAIEIPLHAEPGSDLVLALHLHESGRKRRVGLLSVTWKT